jgi:hypothetical protein
MHGGWQLLSPTLLVEVEENILLRCVALYALANVWRRGEREKHMRAFARLASSGEARRWAWAHDVRMNSSPKSSPKPHSFAASFCRLFLL